MNNIDNNFKRMELEAKYTKMIDHDLLTSLATEVKLMSEDVKEVCSTQKDHEKRITVMETTWKVIVGILVVVVPTVVAIVWDMVK
jgi:hypothetical protein